MNSNMHNRCVRVVFIVEVGVQAAVLFFARYTCWCMAFLLVCSSILFFLPIYYIIARYTCVWLVWDHGIDIDD